MTEAPTKEPTTVAEAPLLGPGAGAGTSASANAALMEAATMRTTQETFLMSMMIVRVFGRWRDPLGLRERSCLLFVFWCRSEEE